MKQEQIIAWSDILATQMNHWTLFSIAAAISIMSGVSTLPVALWFFSGLIPVLFFYIRRYTNSFPVMALSHILCLVVLFFVPVSHPALRIILCVYGIGLTVNSFAIRLRTKERLDEAFTPPVAIGIIALSAFFLHYQEYTKWDSYYIILAAVYFIGYFIRYFFEHYLYFITVNSGSTGYIPRREIFLSGLSLTGIFAFFGVSVLVLISDTNWLSFILRQLRSGIIWLREHGVFAWLASLFGKEEEALPEQVLQAQTSAPESLPLEMGDPGLFWVILEKIAFTLIPIALLCLLCFMLYRSIKTVISIFRQKRQGKKEISAESAVDIRETYEIKKNREKQKDFFAFLNPTERIRRIYKQRIWAKRAALSGKEESRSLNTYTARECGSLLSESRLALIYEKARYSNIKCTRDDVKKAAEKSGTAD